MKEKYRKILAIVLSVIMCISVMCIPVSAMSDADSKSYYSHFVDYTMRYIGGQMTYSEYKEKLSSLDDTYNSGILDKMLTHETGLETAMATSLLGFSCDVLGIDDDSLRNKFLEWYTSNPVYHGGGGSGGNRGELVNSFDLKGYGACVYYDCNNGWERYLYCDYIVLDDGVLESGAHFSYVNAQWHTWYQKGNKGTDEAYSGSLTTTFNSKYTYKLYGDVRYSDDTPADEYSTEIITYVPDLGDCDEDTQMDFLKDLLSDLQNQYPDLSTVEGLLQAIYNRLGTLDSDDDNQALNL